MQGCLSCQTPNDSERYIFEDDDNKIEVEAIVHFKLLLKTDCYLNLKETFVVLSFRRNLISISVLDKSRYSCLQGNGKFSRFQGFNLISTRFLINNDNLYLLDTIASYNDTFNSISRSTKQKLSENFTFLWHKCLGHISKQRIEKLASDGILHSLDSGSVW